MHSLLFAQLELKRRTSLPSSCPCEVACEAARQACEVNVSSWGVMMLHSRGISDTPLPLPGGRREWGRHAALAPQTWMVSGAQTTTAGEIRPLLRPGRDFSVST